MNFIEACSTAVLEGRYVKRLVHGSGMRLSVDVDGGVEVCHVAACGVKVNARDVLACDWIECDVMGSPIREQAPT